MRIAMGACIMLTALGCGHGAGGVDLWQEVPETRSPPG